MDLPTSPARAERDQVAHCAIAVMAKASKAGRTKTRLAPPLSLEEAARLNTAFLSDIAGNLIAAAAAASIAGYFATAPSGEDAFFDDLPAIGRFDASLPGFGACLHHAIAVMFERGHRSACVLNADSPTLPGSILIEAARHLEGGGDRVVLGPSEDGGYYLLGMTRPHPRLFEDIAWSTERVAEQTLDRAAEIGVRVHLLPRWYDVDEAETLHRLWDELFAAPGAGGLDGPPQQAPASRALLRDLDRTAGLGARLGFAPLERATG